MVWGPIRPKPREWAKMYEGVFDVRYDASGFAELWFSLTNLTQQTIALSEAFVALSYTTFAGGRPAVGGNGIDFLALFVDPAFPTKIAPHERVAIPIETAKERLLTRPKTFTRAFYEDEDAVGKRRARLEPAYQNVAEALAAAPSLVDYISEDAALSVDLKFDGQIGRWAFHGL